MEQIQMKCKDCGKEIPKARLEALPGVRYCIKCADKHTEDIKAELKIDPNANYPRGW